MTTKTVPPLALAASRSDQQPAFARWVWDIATGAVYVNEQGTALIGLEPMETLTTISELLALMHPEDRDQVLAIPLLAALNGDPVRAEHRVKTRAGGWLWIVTVGRTVERDALGKPVRMLGTSTSRREAAA